MNRIPVAALAAFASLGTASAQSHYAGVFDDICEAGLYAGVALTRAAGAAAQTRLCAPDWMPADGIADADSQFYIASVTKTFTSILVLQQAEAGRLGLDDPVAAWLPGLASEIGETVTVRHLLTHTAGLMRDHSEGLDPGEHINDLALALDAINAVGLMSAPGERYSYSNTGYFLLAHILETATGERYDTLLADGILVPAGMTATGRVADPARRITGYDLPDLVTPQPVPEPAGLFGAGQLYSTAADLDRFAAALRDGRLLTQEQQDWLLSGIRAEGMDGSEAPGWILLPLGENLRAIISIGAADGFSAILIWIEGEPDISTVFLINSTAPGQPVARTLLSAALRDLALGREDMPALPPAPLQHYLDAIRNGDVAGAVQYARGLDYSGEETPNAAPVQATGAPDGGIGETSLAWAPATANAGAEWLEVAYDRPVTTRQIDIHFTQIPDTFVGLDIGTDSGTAPAYEIVRAESEAGAPIVRAVLAEAADIRSVRVHLDTSVPGWPQIDAVGLTAPDGSAVWATSARASTSAFDSGGVTAHDLPSVAILNVLADRLEANDHPLLAAQVRQTIPLIHG